MERTDMPKLRNVNKRGFEPGLTWLRVRRSTTELPRSSRVALLWMCNRSLDGYSHQLQNGGHPSDVALSYTSSGMSIAHSCRARTLRSSSPWDMFSASMKDTSKWWMLPASPEWGRSVNVLKPRSLKHTATLNLYKLKLPFRVGTVFPGKLSWTSPGNRLLHPRSRAGHMTLYVSKVGVK